MKLFWIEWHYYVMFAAWIVYKFKNYIWSTEDEGPEEVGRYTTSTEAYVKTRQQIKEVFPESHDLVHVERKKDKAGWYWVIEVPHIILKWIFIPVPTSVNNKK